MCELLRGGRPNEALDLLAEGPPALAWVRDQRSGGYAVHLAAWHGYESVATFLGSLPGVLEQRDGARNTALGIARHRGHREVEAALLEAGANTQLGGYAAPAGVGKAAAEGEVEAAADAEYCSWSEDERRRYRGGGGGGGRGGAGRGGGCGMGGSGGRGSGWRAPPPPGLQRVPSGSGDPKGGGGAEVKARCPW